jgi:hypothetical protein
MLKSLISASSGGIAGDKFTLEFPEATFGDRLAGIFHEFEIEIEVVKGEHALSRDFAGPEAVTQKCFGKTGNVRVGVGTQWKWIELEFLIFNVDGAVRGEGLSVAGAAGGVNAVKHINALANHFEKLGGRSKSHRVAGFVLRKEGFGVLDGGEHFVFRFTDRDSADGVSVEIEIDEFAGGLLPEIGIDASLNDSEVELSTGSTDGLVGFNPLLAALSPSGGEVGGFLGILAFTRVGRAFIKKHRDVRAEDALDLHTLFRAEHHAGAVEVALKLHSLLRDLADFGKRPDLEAARIGEHGAVPGREVVEAAKGADDIGARAQPEMIGVPKNDLGIHHDEVIRMERLDRALGANGHKNRGLDDAVGSREATAAGLAIGVSGEEFEHWAGAGVIG